MGAYKQRKNMRQEQGKYYSHRSPQTMHKLFPNPIEDPLKRDECQEVEREHGNYVPAQFCADNR